MTPAQTKKWWERVWAEEAAKLLEKNWALGDDREEPDFLVKEGDQMFGLEITQTFEDLKKAGGSELRKRESFNADRLLRLSKIWADRSDTILKVEVLGRLTDQNESEIINVLTEHGLAQRSVGDPMFRMKTPSGINVFARVACRSNWSQIDDEVGWVTQDAVAQAQAAIDKKSIRISSYRKAIGDDVRLLIVADHRRSRLRTHSQNRTVAARAMADRKTVGQRS